MTVAPYFSQEHPYTCSLAVLRMVLAHYGKSVSEEELIAKVEPVYGSNFKNLWNPTIAKLACEYGLETTIMAAWPLFKPEIYPKALVEYQANPETMNYKKYENPNDKDVLTEPLPLAYKEMFRALELGCKCTYGKLTATKVKRLLDTGNLIQTLIKLHKLYPDKKHVFHSILIYGIEGDTIYYQDPAHGANLICDLNHLIKAANNVGAAIIYSSR